MHMRDYNGRNGIERPSTHASYPLNPIKSVVIAERNGKVDEFHGFFLLDAHELNAGG